MGKGGSSSQTASTTQSVSEDNRIVNDNGGITLGKDAALLINNELSNNALDLGLGLIDLAKSAGELVAKQTEQATDNSKSTLSTVTAALNNQQLGTSQAFTNMIPLLIAGVVVVIIFGMLFNKGK